MSGNGWFSPEVAEAVQRVGMGGGKQSQSRGNDSGEEEGPEGVGGRWVGLSLEQGQTSSPVTSNLTAVTTFFSSEP